MNIRFSPFRREDFPEYQSWYKDADLNTHLGPMDEEWLEHVLHETDGRQYSVFRGEELIAVIGIKFPTAQYPAYYITDFAMKPHLRSKGIGSEVLSELVRLHPLSMGQTWRAFVDIRNPRARAFFEKNEWICTSEKPDEHGMLTLECHPASHQ